MSSVEVVHNLLSLLVDITDTHELSLSLAIKENVLHLGGNSKCRLVYRHRTVLNVPEHAHWLQLTGNSHCHLVQDRTVIVIYAQLTEIKCMHQYRT